MNKTPTTLIIMDGFGMTEYGATNAVSMAKTPVLDRLFKEYANTTLSASGLDVGLPDGQMGNSEVGHTNIGGGRVVFQDLPRISRAIDDGSFFKNPAYNKAMDDCLAKGSSLHLYGLLSDGGVHSHITHIYGLLELAKRNGLEKVYLHAFLDGRDTPPASGADYVAELSAKCKEIGVGEVVMVSGRYYAMDRDNNFDRLKLAYDAICYGRGNTYNNYNYDGNMVNSLADKNYDNGDSMVKVVSNVMDIKDNYSYDVNVAIKKSGTVANSLEDVIINYKYAGKVYKNNMVINKRYADKSMEYYKVDDKYYMRGDDEEYVNVLNNEIYDLVDSKYIEFSSLKKYIKEASLDHKTDYSSGKLEYLYNLKISDLINDSSSDDIVEIYVTVFNNEVNINIDYTEIMKFVDSSISECNITYTYKDIGEVLIFRAFD